MKKYCVRNENDCGQYFIDADGFYIQDDKLIFSIDDLPIAMFVKWQCLFKTDHCKYEEYEP